MTDLTVLPTGSLQGKLRLPGDKSLSHRALMLSAIAEGDSTIRQSLLSEDTLATANALMACGVPIHIEPSTNTIRVKGVGLRGLKPPVKPLDCGNAGTCMRLLAGLLSAQSFDSTLVGDLSLQKRPMERVIAPLKAMGANIQGTDGCAPLYIQKTAGLKGLHYAIPVPSAQVKSALLLAGLYAAGDTTLIESQKTRDHTERLLEQFGASICIDNNVIVLKPVQALKAQDITIPGDISSAAFFMVGASIAPDSDILLKSVGVNETRSGILSILKAMGAKIAVLPGLSLGSEPIADIRIQGGGLNGIVLPPEWVVPAIDEFPAIFIAAACATGQTVMRGLGELRFKESDRIQTMVAGLRQLGVAVEVLSDGVIIHGQPTFKGATVDSDGDHRVAMALSLGALRTKAPIIVKNTAAIGTSFPQFQETATMLGFKMV